TFGGWQLDGLMDLLNLEAIRPIALRIPEELAADMRIALRNAQDSFPQDFENSAIVYRIIMRIATEGKQGGSGAAERRDTRLQAVLDYIDLNHNTVLTIDGLASVADVSPQHLCRMFRDQLGCRPFEHVNRVRISKSKTLMISDSGRRIKDIALACGFEHESYFSGVFRRIEGISPREFRNLHLVERQLSSSEARWTSTSPREYESSRNTVRSPASQ
ncbi:MAG: helix-turn-helix transcriptional regulator, partial [Spirochaetales bacterium]